MVCLLAALPVQLSLTAENGCHGCMRAATPLPHANQLHCFLNVKTVLMFSGKYFDSNRLDTSVRGDGLYRVTSLAPGRRLSDVRRRRMQCLTTLTASRALTTTARSRNGPPMSYRDRPPAVTVCRSDRVNASPLSHLNVHRTTRNWNVGLYTAC